MRPIHVGIVTYNSLDDLPECLACVRAQTAPLARIGVVDNASSDGVLAWLRHHAPDVHVIALERNIGFGSAHNLLIRDVPPDGYYLCLNPDARLQPDYVARLAAQLDADDGAGSAVGKLIMPEGRIYSAGHAMTRAGFFVNIGYNMNDAPIFNQPREVFGAPGAAALYAKRMLDDVGGFDEDIFLYHEETDLDWRARRRGWRCWYVPEAVGVHPGYKSSPVLRVEVIGNRYLSAIKNADPLTLWALVLPRLLLHLPLRLIVTPRFGWRLMRHIWRKARRFYRKRGERQRPLRPGAPPVDLRPWYAWAAHQPHRSPTSFRHFRPQSR